MWYNIYVIGKGLQKGINIMIIYLLKETDRGLLGAFKSKESVIKFLKENWELSDDYTFEDYGCHGFIVDNNATMDSYFFTLYSIILHD